MSDVKWDRNWFVHLPKFEKSYWKDINNQRGFLESIASEYGVYGASDWQKVSTSLIRNKQGAGLLAMYNNSLASTIQALYPESWESNEGWMSKVHKNMKGKLYEMIK